ncbi:uncharacterized protein N7525_011128 [Penicillium rubens]|uniref:uncharacterized protein n=1 Tax=Penicillium rubens TaxID=1108849 RepID=UPI002A59CB9D|nr:uncharacterized protein N7525_011128 [Penicillium rubens]KAJ5821844.1 hypothetical protein N7525_011128 [Penicillium rubens]
MFIDIADDKGRSRKRKRTEKKKPSTLLLNKEVRHKPLTAYLNIFFVYEHRYTEMIDIKAKRTPRRSPRSYLRGALRHPAKLFWALQNERRKKKST